MGDINIFKIQTVRAEEIKPVPTKLEKIIQTLIEKNLEEFFDIRFVKTEHPTGKKHRGRIDTLGLDENNCPVIIEYKRQSNENVINQGLYYLDWLLDHKAEFEHLAKGALGKDYEVDWSSPRLLCIAQDFTKYDAYAIEQIDRNIELIRYRLYEQDIILFELVNAMESETATESGVIVRATSKKEYKTVKDSMDTATELVKNLITELEHFIMGLGEDVQRKELKLYIAYKKIKNFACLEVHNEHILVYLKLDPKSIDPFPSIARDVSNKGHWGTGDIELRISTKEELDIAKRYIEQSYEMN